MSGMPDIQALLPERHGSRRFRRYAHYQHAAADAVVPLVAQELPRAALAMPIGFVQSGERFLPVAVQGLVPGRNLWVAADGRWLGAYVPALYRSYPFLLAPTEDGRQVLCVDEASGLLSDAEGEPLFTENGQPMQAVRDILDFLSKVSDNRVATERMCATLGDLKLLRPWPIQIQTEQGVQPVQGLWQVDEAALNQLPSAEFETLRQSGALPMVYCQLLSTQHLPRLGQLAQAHAQFEARMKAAAGTSGQAAGLPTTATGDLDLEFLKGSETLTFGNLG